MGDHRPIITAHFEMHGHVADYDFGWCNWSPNSDGVDQRIIDWFADQAEIAMLKFHASMIEAETDSVEASERAQLARLRAKYETDSK